MTNKRKKIIVIKAFTGMLLIPILAISIFAYYKVSVVYSSSNTMRRAYEFEAKAAGALNQVDIHPEYGNLQVKSQLRRVKFKPEDKVYIYSDGNYTNIDDPSDTVKPPGYGQNPVYWDDSSSIYSMGQGYDMYGGPRGKEPSRLALVSNARTVDMGSSRILINILGGFSVAALVAWGITTFLALRIRWPHRKLKRAAKKAVKGDFENVAINFQKDEEFREIYGIFNDMAAFELSAIESLSLRSESLEKEAATFETMVKTTENTLNNIIAHNRSKEIDDRQLQIIINTVEEVIFKTDENLCLTFVNKSFENTVSMEADEIIGNSIYEFICFSDMEMSILESKSVTNSFITERKLTDIIIHFKKSDGSLSGDYSMDTNPIELREGEFGIQAMSREVKAFDVIEDTINKRNYEINQIRSLDEKLSLCRDIDSILETMIEEMKSVIDAGFITIRLFDDDDLVLRGHYAKPQSFVLKETLNLEDRLIDEVFSMKELMILKRSDNFGLLSDFDFQNDMEEFCELVLVPIRHENKRVGVLISGVHTDMDASAKKILASFAHHGAIAIDKAGLYDKLRQDYMNTIKALASAMEAKDEYTEGHSNRVSRFSVVIAREMGIEGADLSDIEISGILHDIGKIGIDDDILTKPGRLTDEEFEAIKQHPSIGHRIVGPIGLPQNVVDGILYHHCKYDLTGYPGDVAITELSLVARIIGVSDAFDAITSKRSYSEKQPAVMAFDELKKWSGTQFCPHVVSSFCRIYERDPKVIEEIMQDHYSD